MTVYKAIKPEAYAAADLAYALIKGEHPKMTDTVNNDNVDVPSKLLTPVAVTKPTSWTPSSRTASTRSPTSAPARTPPPAPRRASSRRGPGREWRRCRHSAHRGSRLLISREENP
jgi:hypothetical protein